MNINEKMLYEYLKYNAKARVDNDPRLTTYEKEVIKNRIDNEADIMETFYDFICRR